MSVGPRLTISSIPIGYPDLREADRINKARRYALNVSSAVLERIPEPPDSASTNLPKTRSTNFTSMSPLPHFSQLWDTERSLRGCEVLVSGWVPS